MINKIYRLPILEKLLISWGLFWGILGLFLFGLGLIGLFYRFLIILIFVVYSIGFLFLGRKFILWQDLKLFFKNIYNNLIKDRVLIIFALIFLLFFILNFLAALAPELGYDALWYHLTLPKIWLMTHQISYLAGTSIYYSVMPRLAEIFFSVGLSFDTTGTVSKIIHLFFGLFWFLGILIFVRLFLTKRISFLMAVTVYGTVWISWLSQTAYIDLVIAFYVLLSIYYFFRYLQSREELFLILSAVFMGFNLASKIYGLNIFAVLSLIIFIKAGWRKSAKFIIIPLLLVLPFYLQAYLATGNPFYPVFSIRDSTLNTYLGGFHTLQDWYLHVWWRALPKLLSRVLFEDFTPVFGFVLYLVLLGNWRKIILPTIIFILFFLFWSLVPMQEPRYFLVILPVLAYLIGEAIEQTNYHWQRYLVYSLMFIALIANFFIIFKDYQKSFVYLSGKQSKIDYLKENLPLTRNFYDADGFFKKTIKSDDKVLTVEIGNMFYINFPFWDWSFIAERENYLQSPEILSRKLKEDGFTYILLGKINLEEFSKMPPQDLEKYFEIIYKNGYYSLYKIKEI